MLAHYFARRRASHVHSDVAAPDNDDFLPDGELVAEIDVEQELDAAMHAVEVNTGDGEIPATVSAKARRARGKDPITTAEVVAIIGPIKGATIMAPITVAVELERTP